jgi:hypothetical protein
MATLAGRLKLGFFFAVWVGRRVWQTQPVLATIAA